MLMAAQCKNIDARVIEDHRKETGRGPGQSQLLFQQFERTPVKVPVCVVQVVTGRHRP